MPTTNTLTPNKIRKPIKAATSVAPWPIRTHDNVWLVWRQIGHMNQSPSRLNFAMSSGGGSNIHGF
jgi:hypothetical protein